MDTYTITVTGDRVLRMTHRPLDSSRAKSRDSLGMSPHTRRGVVPSEAQPSRGTTKWSPGLARGAPQAEGQTEQVVREVCTVAEVCRRLRKSRRQVYRYLRTERLKPCARILGQWLFARSDVDRFEQQRLPTMLRPFFWDVRLSSVSADRHSDFILARLLEFGDRRAVAWAFQRYPRERLIAFLNGRGRELLSRRAWRLWASLVGLKPLKDVRSVWRRRASRWGGLR